MRWSKKKIALYLLFGVPLGMYLGMSIGVTRMAMVFLEEFYESKNTIERIIWYQEKESLEICVEGYLDSVHMSSYLVKIPLNTDAYYLSKDKRYSFTDLQQNWLYKEACLVDRHKIMEDARKEVKVGALELILKETFEVIAVVFLINGSELDHEFTTFTSYPRPHAVIEWSVLILALAIDVIIWPMLVVFMFLLASFA